MRQKDRGERVKCVGVQRRGFAVKSIDGRKGVLHWRCCGGGGRLWDVGGSK